MPLSPRMRQGLRRLAVVVGILLGLVTLPLVALQLGAVRGFVLSRLLQSADVSLPGHLVVRQAAWPALSHLHLQGVTWTLQGESLAVVDDVELRYDVWALVRRQLHVPFLHLRVAQLDVPRIQNALRAAQPPEGASQAVADSNATAGVPWLRNGSVSGVPSLWLEDLDLQVNQCQLSDSSRIVSLHLGLRADLREGAVPHLALAPLTLQMRSPDLEIINGDANLDLESGVFQITVHSADAAEWNVAIDTRKPDTDSVTLQVLVGHRGAAPFELLSARGLLQSDGSHFQGVRLLATLHTPDVVALRDMPLLGPSFETLPDLQGVGLQVSGDVFWAPEWRMDLETTLLPNDWLEGGTCRVVQHAESLRVEGLDLRLHDLQIGGDWSRNGTLQQGHLQARMQGTGWMQDLVPDVAPPDRVAVDLDATLLPSADAPRWEATLRASLQQGEATLQDLLCRAQSVSSPKDLRFHVQARAQGWDLTMAGEGSIGDSVQVRLDPLHLQQAGNQPLQQRRAALAEPTGACRVIWHPQRGVHVSALRVDGDVGVLRVDGSWRAASGGSLSITGDWPQPPAVLVRAVAADSARQYRLQHDWPSQDTPHLRLLAQAVPRNSGTALTAQADVLLPGPRSFAFALPESLVVEDLDVLRGQLQAEAFVDSQTTRWDAHLDLSQTAWLDSTGVRLHADADSFFVDSLRLLWDGLDVQMKGVADTAHVALRGTLQWDAAPWIERLPMARQAGVSLGAQAQWSIAGRAGAPDIEATLQAQAASHWGSIPHLDAEVTMRQGTVRRAHVEAPQGIHLPNLSWDRLLLTVQPGSAAADSLSRLHFDLSGKQQAVHAALRVDLPRASVIHADTLEVRLFERALATSHPFVVRRSPQGIYLEQADFAGSLGSIHAQATVTSDTLDLLALADLQLPAQPEFLALPPGLWPQTMRLRAAATGNDSFAVFLQTSGLQLADHEQVSVLADIFAHADSTRFTLQVVDPQDTLLTSRGNLPLQWSLRPLQFALQQDSLLLDARFVDFPIPDVFEDPRTAVDYLSRSNSSGGSQMNGELHVDGQLEAPRAYGYLQLQPETTSLAAYRAYVFVALQQEASRWNAAVQQQLDRLSTRELLRPPGAKLAFWVMRDTSLVLDAAVHMPVQVGVRDGALHVESGAQLRAALRSATLQLADFNPLLPPRTSLDGVLRIDVSAEGAWKDPQLQGGLRFTDLALGMPDGSRARASGAVDVQGKASDPGVTGKITVRDGLIRIPELPRSLLPTQGEALLLTQAEAAPQDSGAARATTAPRAAGTQAARAPADSSHQHARPAPVLPKNDTDVFLQIPGAFWIRGRGFEVELSGNLHLTVRDGQVRVLGELKAERGDLKLLASRFPIKTGRVIFYGDDETNPSLDLVMGRTYDDVSVEVVVQGTAKEPEIEFRSDPQLSEEEILSYVLFGRGTSKLDETQTSQFDERALALASVLTSNLGEGIRAQTGVDMIGLEQSAETADRASLVVGKYLSPRVLLKYVQDLEKGRGYAVNVEYWLRGGLRLMTTSSRYNPSGMELNWSHEY